MSDISITVSANSDESLNSANPIKQKNSDQEHISTTQTKKIRLDNTSTNNYDTNLINNSIHPTSSSCTNSESIENESTLPLSPQSEQTASTSSSSGCYDLANFFKDNRIPIPNTSFQNPRQLLGYIVPSIDVQKLPSNLDDFDICRLIYQMASSNSNGTSGLTNSVLNEMFIVQREKLKDINTLEQCVDLIHKSKNIIVLTGAGCSVSCGIPDFRSRDGVYARLRVDFPDLPDPQAMFDIFYFDHDPRPFFKFAKEIYPGQFTPSLSHMFIKKLEQNQKLLRNYTQNIDTLEMTAEIKRVIQCHGSFATATCTTCKLQVDADHIREKILNQEIPYCEKCKINETFEVKSPEDINCKTRVEEESSKVSENIPIGNSVDPIENESTNEQIIYKKNNSAGILKPDIVFFGEGLPELYHQSINEDKNKCDLLIVIGSSLKVKPVANIPHLLPKSVPQILINREPLKHLNFDIELLGDCDVIVNEILLRLQEKQKQNDTENITDESIVEISPWSTICRSQNLLKEIADDEAESLLFNNKTSFDQYENSNTSSPDNSTIIFGENKSSSNSKEQNQNECIMNNSAENLEISAFKKRYIKDYLKESSYLYLKPNMYIFHGAEIQLRHTWKKLKKLNKTEEKEIIGNGEGQFELSDDSEDDTDMTDSDDDDDEDDEDDDEESDEEQNDEVKQCDEDSAKLNNNNLIEKDDDDDSDEEDGDFNPDDPNGIPEEVTNFNKKNLIDFLNEDSEFEDEEDDEDFAPETSMNKKQLSEFLNEKLNSQITKKPDM